MKVYIDLLLFLNFSFDFLLLLSVSLVLRRNAKIFNIMLGAFFGSLTTLLLFTKITTIGLFMFKVLISIGMIIITFKYKNIKYFFKNFMFLYINSIVLGGILYFINVQFSYKNNGLVFFNQGLSINFVLLFLLGPFIMYIYIKENIKLRNNYSKYYEIDLYYLNNKFKLTGYYDTGNVLTDPYFNKPIIFINNKELNELINNDNFYIVPYKTVDGEKTAVCYKVDKMIIKGIGIKKKFLISFCEDRFSMNGIDCILNRKLLEG